MAAPITFTLDLEDHRPHPAIEARHPAVTRRILDELDQRGITGTFFIVGVIAEAEPKLVREIAGAGHELGLHGWRHKVLTEQTPDELADHLRRGKELLEDLGQQEVVGFRAPTFSLVAETVWATDVLLDAGYRYSSSVLPGPSPLYGFPGAPRDPFRWPNGLAELPVATTGLGRAQLPYLGGTYLRVLPRPLITLAHRRGGRRLPWTYVHPYDIDTEEPYWVVPDAGWMSPALWIGRAGLLAKLDHLGDGDGRFGPPLRDRIHLADEGPVFRPAALSPNPTPAAEAP